MRDKLVKQIAKDRADRKDLLSKLTVGRNQAYSKCPNHGVLEGVRYGPHNPAPCGCRFLWIGPDLIAWSDELNKFAPYENPPELSETENFSHVFSARLKKTIDEKTEID